MSNEIRSRLLESSITQLAEVAIYDGPVVVQALDQIVDVLLSNGRTVSEEHIIPLSNVLNSLAGAILGMETLKRSEEEQKIQNKKLFSALLAAMQEARLLHALEGVDTASPNSRN